MTTFFKLICIAFSTITLCAVILGYYFSWKAFSPRISQERRDEYSDRCYECVHVSMWTLIAAGVSSLVWIAFECIEMLEIW